MLVQTKYNSGQLASEALRGSPILELKHFGVQDIGH